MKCTTEEQRIAERYKKFGVSLEWIQEMVVSGLKHGLSRKAALIGLRMALGKECDLPEYFSPEDVAEASGLTVEEVDRYVEEHKDELIANGGIAEVTIIPPNYMQ